MNRNRLPRWTTDVRSLGVTDTATTLPSTFYGPPAGLAFAAPSGTGEGGAGGSGGGGGTGDGGGNDKGTGSDTDDGPAKPLADMTAEEQAAYWKRMSRKHEAAARQAPDPTELAKLRESAAELDKIRDGQRTEAEKATARADKAEGELAKTTARLLRAEVALDKGLTKSQAARLVGNTQAELEADADLLLEEFGASKKAEEDKAKEEAKKGRRQMDGGTRGGRNETKPTVASGADLYASRNAKKTT